MSPSGPPITAANRSQTSSADACCSSSALAMAPPPRHRRIPPAPQLETRSRPSGSTGRSALGLRAHDLEDDPADLGEEEPDSRVSPGGECRLRAGEPGLDTALMRELQVASPDRDAPDVRSLPLEHLELAAMRGA